MAGETVITVIGNLTADPELRTIGAADRPQIYGGQNNFNLLIQYLLSFRAGRASPARP